MSLYLQMEQRDQAMQGINSGLALIAANHSPPSMRNAIMQSANAGAGDAGTMVEQPDEPLQRPARRWRRSSSCWRRRLRSRRSSAWTRAPCARRSWPGAATNSSRRLEPTTEARNIQAEHDTYIKGGGAEEIDAGAQSILLGAGGGGAAGSEMASMNLARSHWLADPANTGQAASRLYD